MSTIKWEDWPGNWQMPIHPHKMELSCKSKLYSSRKVFKAILKYMACYIILLSVTITYTIIELNGNLVHYHAVRILHLLIVYLPRSTSSNHDCVYFFNPFLEFSKFLRHILRINTFSLALSWSSFIFVSTLLRVYIALTFQSSFLGGYNFEN